MTQTQTAAPRAPAKTPAERAELLRAAARQVEDAIRGLDTRKELCGGCNLHHAVNFAEMQAHSALQGMADKLARWAATLERPDETELPHNRREPRRA